MESTRFGEAQQESHLAYGECPIREELCRGLLAHFLTQAVKRCSLFGKPPLQRAGTHCKTPGSCFDTSAASARGRCQETPDLHGDTLLSILARHDLLGFSLEPVPKQRITPPQRQLPCFGRQSESRPGGLSLNFTVERVAGTRVTSSGSWRKQSAPPAADLRTRV